MTQRKAACVDKVDKDMKRVISKLKKYNKYYAHWLKYPKFIEKLPIDNNTIFIESDSGNKIDGNCYYLAKELIVNKKYQNFKVYISVKNSMVQQTHERLEQFNTSNNLHVIALRSREYYKILASAKYLFIDNTFHAHYIKKPEQIITNMWHGTPLKTLGKDDKENFHHNGNAFKSLLISDNILAPSKFVASTLLRAYQIDDLWNGNIIFGGYPRNSILLNDDVRHTIRKELNVDKYKIYAYMPTYRGTFGMTTRMASTIKMAYHLLEIDNLLNDNEIMYVRLHPIDSSRIGFGMFKHIKAFPDGYEPYEFLAASDCLVTDYSSVMFDYSITKRKIVLFTYDKSEYLEDRGTYLDMDKDLPFTQVADSTELLKQLRLPEPNSSYNDFINKFCKYESPTSCEKLLDTVIGATKIATIEHHNDNGKQNILIYSGNLSKNGITTSLANLLSMLNTKQYNYIVAYPASKTTKDNAKDFVNSVPSEIKAVGTAGKSDLTLTGKIILHIFQKGVLPAGLYMRYMSKYYKLENRREFGNLSFSSVIQFNGYEWKKLLQYSCFNANRSVFVHNNMVSEAKLRKNQRLNVLRYCYSHYDHVVAVADLLKESIHQISPVVRDLAVMPNVVDTDKVLNLSRLPLSYDDYTVSNMDLDNVKNILCDDNKIISTIGRFSPEKAHIRLIEQFGKVWESAEDNQSLYLMIIGGPGPKKNSTYKDELEFIENKPYKDNIILIQSVSNPYNFLKHSMGFILPSLYEGQGIVLMEADILGIPVVATETDGTSDLLGKYHGKIVSNDDNGVLNALKLLLNHKIKPINIDYKKYNSKSIKTFERLVN